jgi:hypothetical protein
LKVERLSADGEFATADEWWGRRDYQLVHDGKVVGELTLVASKLSSREIGKEVGPVLEIRWLTVREEYRRTPRALFALLRFIITECDALQSRQLAGVIFSPDNEAVAEFAVRVFAAVPIGEPSWLFIPLPVA